MTTKIARTRRWLLLRFLAQMTACVMIFLVKTASASPADDRAAFIRLAVGESLPYVEQSHPSIRAGTPLPIASLGKTLTAVAVLRAVEHGIRELNDPVSNHVPATVSRWFSGFPGMRLHHLLRMTSGLVDYYTDDWIDAALSDPSGFPRQHAALHAASEFPLQFAPGSAFDYSNTNYVLLGLILETSLGKSYATIIEEEILVRADMADSFVFGSRPLPSSFAANHEDRALVRRYYGGSGLGDGGIFASARDVARFYEALFIDRVLLSDAALAVMLADPLNAGYGMGLEVEGQIVGHSGGDLGYAADVRMDRRRGVIAVMLATSENADMSWPEDHLVGR